jgi:hypothetical protein
MRIIGLILLIAAAFTSAQTRVMHIHMKDGTTDSIYCSRIDADSGITFDKRKMNLRVSDTVNGIPFQSVLWFCTGQIDSITFDFIGGPLYKFIKNPAPNQIFHIGDTITLQWEFNPLFAGESARFDMSIDGGAVWNCLTQKACYMMYRDSGYIGPDSLCPGIPYWPWPYVRTAGGLVGTWQLVITDPMVLPDVDPTFTPISDAVIIRIKDNNIDDIEHECWTPMFSIKP